MVEFAPRARRCRSIGAAITRRFAADGDIVAFSYFGSQGAAETLTARTAARAMRCDSADRDVVVALVRDRPALDILVVNAMRWVRRSPASSLFSPVLRRR